MYCYIFEVDPSPKNWSIEKEVFLAYEHGMKRSRCSEAQIIGILRMAEAELTRKGSRPFPRKFDELPLEQWDKGGSHLSEPTFEYAHVF